MSVNSRVLRVLRLFSPEKSVWTVDDVASELEVSASSAYRYVQELTAVGYLDPVQGGYALGPGLIELDYLIRRHDPLIHAAVPVMRALLDDTTQAATVILCRRCRDRVMCIHQEQGSLPHRQGGYDRGVAMPMFKGATSRVIMAHETPHVQRRTYAENEADINATAGISTWKQFATLAGAIRRDGYAESVSEISEGIRGIAAPVTQDGRLVAAISLVSEDTPGHPDVRVMRDHVIESARALSNALAEAELLVAR